MSHPLITDAQRAELLANGARTAAGETIDPYPVVKLFTPDAGATWLLTELDPADPDLAFGLCDLGLGFPELGSVRLSEIVAVRGRLGLPVERDLFFRADRPLSRYAEEAQRLGVIRA
ncbi:DUF2958 domain-containing protein [Inquilinus sp. Marseille-Q2685]|uniref:DUF2958 domain-containing protein n=1 Tax=Inquilinus sp. Marseille-Q2685 TaxID=2866581 RepID=UPI001CE3D5B0|nr:DUF2958 domain-containing protein [Inquilinus sp. Marseille-Q2685]